MEDLAPRLKQLSALSQETRLLAFRLLMEAGRSGLPAGTIAARIGVAPNALSSHLNIMKNAGLITAQRDGRQQVYAADINAVNELLSFLVDNCCHGRPEVCASLAELSRLSC